MLTPLERTRDALREVQSLKKEELENRKKSYQLRIGSYMDLVRDAVSEALSRDDFKEAFELSEIVLSVLRKSLERIMDDDGNDCMEEKQEMKLPAVENKKTCEKKEEEADTIRGNKDNPKQFTENSSDAKYRHLEVAVRRGKFMDSEFYPYLSGAGSSGRMWT